MKGGVKMKRYRVGRRSLRRAMRKGRRVRAINRRTRGGIRL